MKTITLAEQPLVKIENREGLYHRNIIDKSMGANHFTFHYAKMEEGGFGVSHSHPGLEHFLLVISGELELKNGQEAHRVPTGTGIFVYPGEVHEVLNVHQGPTEYFVIYSPPRD